jgi:hypothetical protein
MTGAAPAPASESTELTITELPRAKIRVECFAISLSSSILEGFDDEPTTSPSHHHIPMVLQDDVGIVGTITILKNSAMIWMGWGNIQQHSPQQQPAASGIPNMGQLVVAMPRTSYQGAFGGVVDASTSQLLGGDSEEDQLLGSQMASRLSAKLGYPIFVSCQFFSASEPPQEWMAGLDKTSVTQRAAALAERKVRHLLLQEYGKA